MKTENISILQITKRFKSKYLMPPKHNNIIDTSIHVYGVGTNDIVEEVPFDVAVNNRGDIVIIDPVVYKPQYIITYRLFGNFKKNIVYHTDYIECKKLIDQCEIITENKSMSTNQRQELREELSALSKERLIEMYIKLLNKK